MPPATNPDCGTASTGPGTRPPSARRPLRCTGPGRARPPRQAAGRRSGVDLLAQDDQADAALAQLVGQREEVLERPHRAGQAGDDEYVAFAQVGQGIVELGAGGELT
jgi:hypothetical protein